MDTAEFQSKALGKFAEHDELFGKVVGKLAEHDELFGKVLGKLTEHDQRFEYVEGEIRRQGVLMEDQGHKMDLVLEAVLGQDELRSRVARGEIRLKDHEHRLRMLESSTRPR